MVRVEDLNITFFHLPKNAGTSIANWLSDNVNGEEYMNDFIENFEENKRKKKRKTVAPLDKFIAEQ